MNGLYHPAGEFLHLCLSGLEDDQIDRLNETAFYFFNNRANTGRYLVTVVAPDSLFEVVLGGEEHKAESTGAVSVPIHLRGDERDVFFQKAAEGGLHRSLPGGEEGLLQSGEAFALRGDGPYDIYSQNT